MKFYLRVRNLLSEQRGATMVEYGLMVALIAVVAMGAVAVVGGAVSTLFTNVAGAL